MLQAMRLISAAVEPLLWSRVVVNQQFALGGVAAVRLRYRLHRENATPYVRGAPALVRLG